MDMVVWIVEEHLKTILYTNVIKLTHKTLSCEQYNFIAIKQIAPFASIDWWFARSMKLLFSSI